jgi:hypothetical protein
MPEVAALVHRSDRQLCVIVNRPQVHRERNLAQLPSKVSSENLRRGLPRRPSRWMLRPRKLDVEAGVEL